MSLNHVIALKLEDNWVFAHLSFPKNYMEISDFVEHGRGIRDPE